MLHEREELAEKEVEELTQDDRLAEEETDGESSEAADRCCPTSEPLEPVPRVS